MILWYSQKCMHWQLHYLFVRSQTGIEPVYLLVPSKSAEYNVMPLILNAATPVGTVSKPITSSGSKTPDSLRNLIVSDWTNYITCDFPTPPGQLRNTLQVQLLHAACHLTLKNLCTCDCD